MTDTVHLDCVAWTSANARRALAMAAAVALLVLLQSPGASAQRMRTDFLVYEPTPQNVVDKMLEVAKVTANDLVVDLGSGDGRIPITAASRYGARGFGVDIDPKLIVLSRGNAKAAGVVDRVEFRQQDLFKTSVRDATVVALYLYVWANLKLRPRLIGELRPGSRIVAHNFPVGEDWLPDLQEWVGEHLVYLWYVPANVAGRWQVTGASTPFTLDLWQQFQRVEATVTFGNRSLYVPAVRLRGDEIEFSTELADGKPTAFRGKVTGDVIAASGDGSWRAVRTPVDEGTVLKRKG
jgi:hypothetical protein